ncbi:MAG: ABC transporter permease [Alphaproteobacteria bacterium]
MIRYVAHRLLVMVPTLLVISFLVFVIIQLPPGDVFSNMVNELRAQGERGQAQLEYLRQTYGFDRPFVEQYLSWLWGLLNGNFGYSFDLQRPVSQVVGERFLFTFILNFFTILFIWVAAFPIGVYSAVYQYSVGDYLATFIGYLGLAVPNFLLAIIMLYFANVWFGTDIGGLMDDHYRDQPWSWGKVGSVLEHLWVPVVIIGTAGTAGMIRRLRANVLDELQKQYVITARAKGVPPGRLLIKYPLRMALNPFIADIGNLLPQVISGAAIVSVVLGLDTSGEMLVRALQVQDMYLAGTFLMFLAVLTVFGTLVSDLLLAWLDPRIRLGGGTGR